ncbi:Pleiotropic drug resistance ABC transporter protein [Mycena venus]|uniref:Pleiotropic drug resistance ABC transporter protein n=1 Tax=Mycena venus TaxID=2733690 RepID=A0A8H7DCL6_9AGAR|nr:Pleiotropic drug resistance ABC transporter protein [Mycena venus]
MSTVFKGTAILCSLPCELDGFSGSPILVGVHTLTGIMLLLLALDSFHTYSVPPNTNLQDFPDKAAWINTSLKGHTRDTPSTPETRSSPALNIMDKPWPLNKISADVIMDDTLSESEIYSTQMLREKRGYPLYVPGPQESLPEEYRRVGVTIGDVGIITPEGAFDFFFNIYLPADHPINDNYVPENFFPLPSYKSSDVDEHLYEPGSYVSTPSVERLEFKNRSSEQNFFFNCHSLQGAVLALPHGSRVQKLHNVETIKNYATRHAESWFKYINGPRGRGLDGSVYSSHVKGLP